MKLIHATVADSAGAERFLREVKAAGRLSQHPNVTPIYGAGTLASGQPYLIMPFYERGSLAQRIDHDGALGEAEAVELGHTLAVALEYVHQHGVLHRDIKPSNILLSEAGSPLLCDFGVARLTDASVAMHTVGTSVVTWAYGPPEAFTGGTPTAAWDVYSLGATVYTMLAGSAPFIDGNDVNLFAVLNRIGNADVPDLRDPRRVCAGLGCRSPSHGQGTRGPSVVGGRVRLAAHPSSGAVDARQAGGGAGRPPAADGADDAAAAESSPLAWPPPRPLRPIDRDRDGRRASVAAASVETASVEAAEPETVTARPRSLRPPREDGSDRPSRPALLRRRPRLPSSQRRPRRGGVAGHAGRSAGSASRSVDPRRHRRRPDHHRLEQAGHLRLHVVCRFASQ